MVAPRVRLDPRLHVRLRLDARAGEHLRERAIRRDRHVEHRARAHHALVHRLEVVVPADRPAVERDVRRRARVGGGEGDRPRVVPAMRLEHEVRPGVQVRRGGVPREVPVEVRGEPADEEVGARRRGDAALEDEPERDAVRAVHAVVRRVRRPLLEARVVRRGRLEEGAVGVGGEVRGECAGDGDLVAVLHVRADGWRVEDDGDAEGLQLRRRPDSRELQELRGVERPSGNDDLVPSKSGAGARDRRGARVRRGAVEEAARVVQDADCLGRP